MCINILDIYQNFDYFNEEEEKENNNNNNNTNNRKKDTE
jgi:hypothetical protein